MEAKGWRYYNQAVIPACAPHETPDLTPLETGEIWHLVGGRPLLVRYTTDFDCPAETAWWHCIKDTPYDPTALKAKRRYEITKGTRNFDCRIIDPAAYAEEMLSVAEAAFSVYPAHYRPALVREDFIAEMRGLDCTVFGAFCRESGRLEAYAFISIYERHAAFSVLKARPERERDGVNAAVVHAILSELSPRLTGGFYIDDGERSIVHETAFQSYLEKYFGFRRAYCRLHVRYRFPVGLAVWLLYPFRRLLARCPRPRILGRIAAICRMEEYRRGCR